ncbi:Ig-like domain-containing protein [Chryseolinea sp. H1M3-3]|uniref:Ig-like domain-containing protein n=1 Tax=Chryseolinea sp. H1M3-3 TaxID=3034144 RepID=UPI0023EDA7AA|nr:Ig-like domain-containing protein [Chryseolinea sp. H1M3-3]
MNRIILSILLVVGFCDVIARDYYVGGTGASDNNPGTAAQPFATIQKAASVAVAGDIVKIRSGTYRETIVPANSGAAGNPIIYQPDGNATVLISGLNEVGTTGWTLHNGNVYKKSITLPVNGFNTSTTRIENNTTIYANQIFKDGEMMFEARWPKIDKFADLLDRNKFRQRSSMVIWEPGYLQDNGLPLPAPQLQGATLVSNGWFITETRTITSHSGNQLNHADIWNNTATGKWSRQRYYVTGKLALLTQAKEWHYENGTLYFWQPGGGIPSGTIEYKARNWAFDIRGKSNITIAGLTFKGCEPAVGNAASVNTLLDNIRASYMNHHVRHDVGEWQGVGMSKIFGIKLLGANSVIKNSELHSSGSSGVWLGPNCRAENNLMHDMGYVGFWANPISLWDRDGGQVITRNTIYRTGRSCFDFGYNWNGQHFNVEISYNDFSQWGLISQDVGATYAWGQCNLTGMNYHHNWIHDTGAPDGPDVGANVGIYFDQATGPGTIHHNVTWNCGAADVYHEVVNETRNSTHGLGTPSTINFYNNTFANTGGSYPRSYITYRTSPFDIQRNNIYRSQIIIGPGLPGDIANALLPAINPQFVNSGQGGLIYRPNTGSPAINAGVIIPGITDGSVGAPDIGAYEFGGEAWVPGYKPVQFNYGGASNSQPVGSITSPANNTSFAQGTPITITASASDPDGTVTKVEFFNGTTKLGEDTAAPYTFVWNNAPNGTHSLTVKVTDNLNAVITSAARSITVSANSAPGVSITAPANNAQFNTGVPITITATASDTNGSVTKVEFFNGTTKLGEDLTSPYSFTWNNAAAGTHALTAKATDNANSVTTSASVSITVGTGNIPPAVAIITPANNSQFNSGASITITATASDSNGSVSKVEFFNGATKLGEDLTAPYSFTWRSAPLGTHALTAKATDNQNSVTTSSVVSVVVGAANVPPTVALITPSNNARYNNGAPIVLSATAADANGSITKVEFFNGTTKIGEDLTAPYSFTWNGAPAGTHTLRAKATDNQNAVTTSASVSITVGGVNSAPTISITSPLNNSQFNTGTITITATASDANGTVSKVEFFNGTVKLGEDLISPYSFIWANVAAGSYELTATATDNSNAVSTSEVISITVGGGISPVANAGDDIILVLPNNSTTLSAPRENPDGPSLEYTWQQVEGPSSPIFNPQHTEIILSDLVEGTYVFELTVVGEDGMSSSDLVNVIVQSSSESEGIIPRVFTPNGDGKEDYWIWPDDERYKNSRLTILNQAGQIVYEAVSYNNTWDGTMGGQPLQEGQYQYVIHLPDSTPIKASVRIRR